MRKKTGGRIKGTPNKSTLPLIEKSIELGIDPFEVLLLFAGGKWQELGYQSEKYVTGINEYGSWEKFTIDPAVRCKAAMEACQYFFPKRKALEDGNDEIDATPVDQLDLEEMKRLELASSKGIEELRAKIKEREQS